ncbi:hypothetical protein Acsp01_80430 [Actinoplanes sp. NBRC 101535]|nr:hypothetical protein Acsp01_80430 [Actinoplanes sp. NBRC 101535]
MSLFLSYAQEDGKIAEEIARKLQQRHHEVFRFEDPAQRGKQWVRRLEEEINEAQGFLALLSPSYLVSGWCRRERELALIRENDLQADGRDTQFVHVARVGPTPLTDPGFLRTYDWHDLVAPDGMVHLLDVLDAHMGSRGNAAPGDPASGPALTAFRNREQELQQLLHGVTTLGGHCFWLVVAPPQLGKSWLLDQVSAELTQGRDGRPWRVRLVDLRVLPSDVRSDTTKLLAHMFPAVDPQSAPPTGAREITKMISGDKQPYACLLDGADLLDRGAADALRKQLSQVHQRLQASGHPAARLAVVVAGRRNEEWLPVSPAPRLNQLPLTRFGAEVISQALRDLAAQMDRSFSPREMEVHAEFVHRFTEGLPALVVECLQWVRREDSWADIADLDSTTSFDRIARPYVENRLLSTESLMPEGGRDLGDIRDVLSHALRVLTPYRVLTQSHLAHYWAADAALHQAVSAGGWSPPDLWEALNRTALLARPHDEPWTAIHPPIRRLLFRHFHPAAADRAAAHREAATYVEQWMESPRGKESGVGVVERLWHEASALVLERPAELTAVLSATADRMRERLRPSSFYVAGELRDYVATRISRDEELQEVLGVESGLANRLIAIISSPAGGSDA